MQIICLLIIIADLIFGAVFISKVVKYSGANKHTQPIPDRNVAENKPVARPASPQNAQPVREPIPPQKTPAIKQVASQQAAKQPAQPAQQTAQQAAPVKAGQDPYERFKTKPVIAKSFRGVSGQYGGKTFPVNGKIVFGRNPQSANLIFDANAPGVSSVHCELQNTNDGLYLTDIGSTNGTFLNGKKLDKGVRYILKTGDLFYLGTDKNMFTIL